MQLLKRYIIIGILFVIIAGSISHFVYEWTDGNDIVGFFFPINESTWEHMKLVFFPMLLYALFMNWKLKASYPCISSALPLGILVGTFAVPIIFYTYTGILGRAYHLLNLLTFALSVLLGFYVVYTFAKFCKAQKHQSLLFLLIFATIVAFLSFTYRPPNIAIFANPLAETSSIGITSFTLFSVITATKSLP